MLGSREGGFFSPGRLSFGEDLRATHQHHDGTLVSRDIEQQLDAVAARQEHKSDQRRSGLVGNGLGTDIRDGNDAVSRLGPMVSSSLVRCGQPDGGNRDGNRFPHSRGRR